jgi:hypothetical protein
MTVTRQRSIFYFNKEELMEENRVLSAKLATLKDAVHQLKDEIDTAQMELGRPRQKAAPMEKTACVYRPPGLETVPRGTRSMGSSGPSFTVHRQFKRK